MHTLLLGSWPLLVKGHTVGECGGSPPGLQRRTVPGSCVQYTGSNGKFPRSNHCPVFNVRNCPVTNAFCISIPTERCIIIFLSERLNKAR